MDIIKHSAKELSITKSVVEIVSKDTLISEKNNLLGSIENYTNSIANLQARINEIDSLLTTAESLGVKTDEEVKAEEILEVKEEIIEK